MVSGKGTEPLPEKADAILTYSLPKKSLRRFLGMLNFYRRFLPKAAQTQAPLHNLLKQKLKGSAPVNWTSETTSAFESCKEELAQAVLLTHPKTDAPLALFCDASDTAIGGVLQQRVDNEWQPLNFFSKKLNTAEQKYSAYDRELLAIYLSIKHFRHMVEAKNFIIYTDQKPLTFAFQHKNKQLSPRQFRHLDFIAQFSTDIRHISGQENVVADALSRVEEISPSIDFHALAESQRTDQELKKMQEDRNSVLEIRPIPFPGTTNLVFCDISGKTARPFLTAPFRKTAFNSLHCLSHPGANATVKLVKERFVWPSIKRDCREWSRACLQCQRSKISRHVRAPVSQFLPPTSRFEHVHIDIVTLPYSDGYRYCLTMVDRFTRWPEAVPLRDQEASTVAKAFFETWIARFGVPLRVTTDQGRQFESFLFKQLNRLTGSTHIRTTAYHPASNGMVERFHRQLKAAIRCHDNKWTESLPVVLLGIRQAWKEDLAATSAELVYGESLRLPGEFLVSMPNQSESTSAENLAKSLKRIFQDLRPTTINRHGEEKIFVFKDLQTATHVFVRHEGPKQPLQQPYDGPFPVLSRHPKFFVIDRKGCQISISIDRLKPAYTLAQNLEDERNEIQDQRGVPFHVSISPDPEDVRTEAGQTGDQQLRNDNGRLLQTRSGRRVRFPDRYQAGFS